VIRKIPSELEFRQCPDHVIVLGRQDDASVGCDQTCASRAAT
jgi:hypothetical protein